MSSTDRLYGLDLESSKAKRVHMKFSTWLLILPIVCGLATVFFFSTYVLAADVIVLFIFLDLFRKAKLLSNVEVRVHLRGRAFVDEEFPVKFVLLSKRRLRLILSPPASLRKEPRVVELVPNHLNDVVFHSSFGTRGSKWIGPFTIKYVGFDGLFTIVRVEEVDSSVKVLPSVEEVDAATERLLEALPNLKTRQRLAEDYTYVRDLRDYSGEPLNRIHWKNSARFDKLLVKDFETAGTSRVFILLDLNLPGGVYSKAAWTHIRRKYEEDAIVATLGLVKFLLRRHERVVLYLSDSKGLSRVADSDEGHFFDMLADATGTVENTKDTSELLVNLIEEVQPTDTVVILSMFLSRSEVREIVRLKGRCGRVVVLLMPYGFRGARVKKFKTYYEAPMEVRKLYEYAKVLRDENVLIEIWLENVGFQEGLESLSGLEGGVGS